MLQAAGLMRQTAFPLPLQMGRQAVAGLNPFTIQLAPLHLFKGVSTITAKHLNGVHPHCLATQMSRQGRGGTDWTLTTVLLVACSIAHAGTGCRSPVSEYLLLCLWQACWEGCR